MALSTKTISAIVIGNALEWYDFVVYSFMTVYIAQSFFPTHETYNSLLLAMATFGVAFCVRPIGGVILGIFADKYGRKRALTLVIALMSVAIFLMVVTPTYSQIGLAAPVIIVISRLLQGLSASGEFGIASSLLIELAPPSQRGFYGSWQMFGQMLALFLGGIIGFLITNILDKPTMESWGWRIPFLVGLIIAPIGFYIRKHLNEPKLGIFSEVSSENKIETIEPVKNHFGYLLEHHIKHMILSFGLIIGGTASIYVNLSFLPTYATHYLNLSMHSAFIALASGTAIFILFIPLFGALSDRINRKVILLIALICYLLTIYPLFSWMINEPSLSKLIIIEMIFCFLLSAYFGVFTTIVAELFPREIRSTGLSISNNLAILLFGGFGQFIVTWMMEKTGSSLALSYYLILTVSATLLAAIFLPNKPKAS